MFKKRHALALELWFAATFVCAACSSFEGASATEPMDAGGDGAMVAEAGNEAAVEAGADVQSEASPLPDYLLVFLSSEEHIGQFPPADGGSGLTGLSGADAFCTRLAEAAPNTKGRRWVAWLSWDVNGGNARTRLPQSPNGDLDYEYRLQDGVTPVFPKGFNFAVLTDGGESLPTNPIRMTEENKVLQSQTVWTGTLQNGTARQADNQCGGWNLDAPDASLGATGNSGLAATWSYGGSTLPCTEMHRLYCFETRP